MDQFQRAEGHVHVVSPLDVALEHAIAGLERALHRKIMATDLPAVIAVLIQLGDEWTYHSRERRWR